MVTILEPTEKETLHLPPSQESNSQCLKSFCSYMIESTVCVILCGCCDSILKCLTLDSYDD